MENLLRSNYTQLEDEAVNHIYNEILHEVNELYAQQQRNSFQTSFDSIVHQQGGRNVFFDVIKQSERHNNKFKSIQLAYKLKFKNLPDDINLLEGIMHGAIRSFLSQIEQLHPNDYVKFFMLHDNLDILRIRTT